MVDQSPNTAPIRPAEASETVSYAILEQTLWNRFHNAVGPDEFLESWLAILCQQIRGAAGGMLIIGEVETGPFVPVAFWPDKDSVGGNLLSISETATSKRQGVIANGQMGDRPVHLMASPIIFGGHLYGVCAIALSDREAALAETMRKIQWACGWMEVFLRRRMQAQEEEQAERNRFAFDMLATILETERFKPACTSLVTEMAMRLECDPVSIGVLRRNTSKVVAVSHSAGFSNKLSLIRDIGNAMDEAIDQRAIVLYPADESSDYRIDMVHRELARSHKIDNVLTIPIQSHNVVVGAITLARSAGRPFEQATIDLCDAVAAVVGPVLEEKRRNDRNIFIKLFESAVTQLKRLFGPHYFGRKLATVAVAAAFAYLSVATTEYTVAAPAVVRGEIQRTIVAPFDGYVANEFAKAGEVVHKGDLLAKLDDQDLNIDRLRLVAMRNQKSVEYNSALADQKPAQAGIVASLIDQTASQLALVEEQLRRTQLVAPFDGVVVEGDLSQSIGAAVQRGQELFKIAPLESYRVLLEVGESDIDDVKIGQTGQLKVAALPQRALDYRIERITAISKQKNGRNFFLVEGAVDDLGADLRPGMEGIGRTFIDDRLLVRVYTQKMIDWVRLLLWRWMP